MSMPLRQYLWVRCLRYSLVHSLMIARHCVLINWDRIPVRAVKGLLSRGGMVSICPLLWQRELNDSQLHRTIEHMYDPIMYKQIMNPMLMSYYLLLNGDSGEREGRVRDICEEREGASYLRGEVDISALLLYEKLITEISGKIHTLQQSVTNL